MAVMTTCPLCNAVVTVGEPNSAGKVICPRCDGAFPFRQSERAEAVPETGLSREPTGLDAEVERHRQARQAKANRSIKRAALVVLGLGALGVATGLAISHFREEGREDRPHDDVETTRPTAPAEMPGLGYLPEGTDSIIAIQVRPLIDSLPEGSTRDARQALGRLGLPAELLNGFERATGLGLDRIDQVLVGLRLKEGSPLNQVVLVAHARAPFDLEAVAERFKANDLSRNGRTYYRVPSSREVPVEVYWWAPNDRVLVAALLPEHLDAVPAERRAGLTHLGARTVEAIGRDLAGAPAFWAVLDSDQWETLGLFLMSLGGKGGKKPQPPTGVLNSLRTLSLAYQPGGESLSVWLDLKSEVSAVELRRRLAGAENVAAGGAGNRVMIRVSANQGVWSAIEPIITSGKK